nr:class D sortase [Peribacillus faecalis]
MRGKIALLFLMGGLFIIAFSIFQIVSSKQQTKETLEKAEKYIEEARNKEAGETKYVNNEEQLIGILRVPKLHASLPIIEGTDEQELEKGVGHYNGTALPEEGEQIVLSGHRDTVFRNFDKLEIGDLFIVELPDGTYTYEILFTEVVDADDTTVIGSKGEEVLTVTTCYPFHYIGNAPERFIFYAYPVN